MNFKHLHYFWVAAHAGGLGRAGAQLHITPQTLSGQIKLLETSLGKSLFRKSGRNLELTDAGRLVLDYADEIFSPRFIDVPYIPLGQYLLPVAYKTYVTDTLAGFPIFWNVKKV